MQATVKEAAFRESAARTRGHCHSVEPFVLGIGQTGDAWLDHRDPEVIPRQRKSDPDRTREVRLSRMRDDHAGARTLHM